MSSIRESRGQLSALPLAAQHTRHLWVAVGVFALAGATSAGCTSTADLPGTSWGTFTVVGTLGTNTCGSGVGPANPWDFDRSSRSTAPRCTSRSPGPPRS